MRRRPDGDAWVRRFHPSEEPIARLACFPHAGGSASYYFPVSRRMAPQIEVLALQYPGRQERRGEPALEDVHELAAAITGALEGWTDGPLAFFGHSMGATVAYEVARLLQESGVELTYLFVSGRRAPSTYRDERVHLRPTAGIVTELHELRGTSGTLLDDDEILQMIMPAIRADYRAIETYQYRPGRQLSCPILAMVGDSDPKASLDEVREWRAHTTGEFEMRFFQGGHFYLDDHATEVIDLLSARLLASAGAAPGSGS